ncbi:hypothetical protein CCP2SC5_1260004 [Azospirillaceae bacterium]
MRSPPNNSLNFKEKIRKAKNSSFSGPGKERVFKKLLKEKINVFQWFRKSIPQDQSPQDQKPPPIHS